MNVKMLSFLLFLIYMSMSSLQASQSHKSIPKIFQGTWAANSKDCGKSFEMNMKIFSNKISFNESSGRVLAVITKQKNELALIVELSGEGDTWFSFFHYKLNDSKQLIDITNAYEKNRLLRYRCD